MGSMHPTWDKWSKEHGDVHEGVPPEPPQTPPTPDDYGSKWEPPEPPSDVPTPECFECGGKRWTILYEVHPPLHVAPDLLSKAQRGELIEVRHAVPCPYCATDDYERTRRRR